MKHIKLYEDFFKFFVYSQANNTQSLWGLTREEVEDLFMEINDYGVSISVDFIYKENSSYNYSVEDKHIRNYLKRYTQGKLTPIIFLSFFNNSNFKGYTKDSEGKPEVYDIANQIDGIVDNLKRVMTDYEITGENKSDFFMEPVNRRLRGGRDNRDISRHEESGVEYGKTFYCVTFNRIPFKDLSTSK
jgi:hypothetical protein